MQRLLHGARVDTKAADADGFVPLFDSKTLNGWHENPQKIGTEAELARPKARLRKPEVGTTENAKELRGERGHL